MANGLSISVAAGAPICTYKKYGVTVGRLKKFRQRVRRIPILPKKYRARLYAAGPFPVATFGAEEHGVDNEEDAELRRAAA